MNKQQQFITEVQTGVILRYLGDNVGGHKAMWEGLIDMDDAFYASERIPEDITAHQAACQFLSFKFNDDKEASAKSKHDWFMRI